MWAGHWMREAFDCAEEAMNSLEVPIGAVFVAHPKDYDGSPDFTKGEIIAKGWNLTNTLHNVNA